MLCVSLPYSFIYTHIWFVVCGSTNAKEALRPKELTHGTCLVIDLKIVFFFTVPNVFLRVRFLHIKLLEVFYVEDVRRVQNRTLGAKDS